MSQQMITILSTVLLVWLGLMPFGEQGIKRILKQDSAAILHTLIGIIMMIFGLALPVSGLAMAWSAPLFLIAGTASVTFGALVLLPEPATLAIMNPRNIGILLIASGIYFLVCQVIIPILPAAGILNATISTAWDGFMAIWNSAWGTFWTSVGSQFWYAIATPILLVAGILIFRRGR